MKRITVLSVCLIFALPIMAATNNNSKYRDELAKHWRVTKDFTIAVANAMPAEDYGFIPNPNKLEGDTQEEMSFGQVIAHIAMANNSAFAMVSGMKAPAVPEKIAAGRKDPKMDKDAVIKFLTDSFDFCLKALDSITDDQLEALTGPADRPQLSGRERLWSYFTHTAHHRGQAEIYLRLKNVRPPQYKF